jgi:hypothetical protein
LDRGEDTAGLMKGIEAYLSYLSKVGEVVELHYPLMRFFEILSRGKPGGPMLPVFEVCLLGVLNSSLLVRVLQRGRNLRRIDETLCRGF